MTALEALAALEAEYAAKYPDVAAADARLQQAQDALAAANREHQAAQKARNEADPERNGEYLRSCIAGCREALGLPR